VRDIKDDADRWNGLAVCAAVLLIAGAAWGLAVAALAWLISGGGR